MPCLAHRNEHYSSGFWSKDVDGVSYNQLHKFWCELSREGRQELLRIDRQAVLEQARKNMCCSKCIGLLLEDFLQIVSSGKQSLKHKGDLPCNRSGALRDQSKVASHRCSGELQDPGVHLWGGLTATRDGLLTVLDCYLYAKSFKGLQNVFESGRARERERELLYPHACGRSQGMIGYGKSHGTTRETCALHTTRLSCDTLVAFLSALEEESRQSLLRMKEEDFIERLTNRFKCKKFCKDCRRNVIREFKELKELKRMQREPQCTDWFCVADTAIQYEVGIDYVRADWSQYFRENDGYQYIEWAIGTEEWETDILKYQYVGNDGSGQVNGLDLRGLRQCYITVRAFKDNGRSSEISVKAHALRGLKQQCVHSWFVAGDGFFSVKRGDCIRVLFEHAEDVEEQEDEVLVDKDGNEVGGECLRPQKHAKTPELAREFLLDAAAVIFREQVEKAYRESRARENAHSIFVCLSTKLLEQRVHIACKEIVTLENQKRLVEEEEKEKLEEEERKGRKRTKEREKKNRRKERLKEKEQKKNPKFSDKVVLSREEAGFLDLDEEMNSSVSCEEEAATETGDVDLSPPEDQGGDCLDGWKRVSYNKGSRQEVTTHYCEEDGKGCFTTKEVGKKMEEVGIREKKNDDMYSKDPMMMSRTSSSDNCSSCLSEGDSNESPSMSDSDDVSQHSEGREDLVSTENYMPDCHQKMTEKNIDERDLLRIKNMSNLPADNMVPSVDTGSSYLSQPQTMMFPQRPPVFQAPGYYHQAPVSWSAAPAKGLMPFPPHPNPIEPLGYGTPLNHSATPFFNSKTAPLFHPYQAQTLEPLEHSYLKEAADERKDMETPSSRGPQTDSDKNFSLFHFGGPVALSTGSKSGNHVFGDLTGNCKNKKEERRVGEEYNLFAKNNSLRFYIF
ncbi:Uncharacterized protein Rs2_10280 [Raphanus sativus]|uniref:Uncharacterized protein LOC108846286 n=1 Tax=Raphanus sativus TaxID=3726 RepID=A0A6J0MRA9_RAPSA|nr:uncharacterized protein LOC108846286 [Raphanus sativus]KAJ4906622.1 Uncharacterized protein Rs2_10280 [Raphanus sativus]